MSDQKPTEINEAFVLTCNLLLAEGYKDLADMQSVIEYRVDDDWVVVFNPSRKALSFNGHDLSPCSMLAFHKEMPVLVFSLRGGAGIFGTEDDYLTAVKNRFIFASEDNLDLDTL